MFFAHIHLKLAKSANMNKQNIQEDKKSAKFDAESLTWF
jgi:hypothetical protein